MHRLLISETHTFPHYAKKKAQTVLVHLNQNIFHYFQLTKVTLSWLLNINIARAVLIPLQGRYESRSINSAGWRWRRQRWAGQQTVKPKSSSRARALVPNRKFAFFQRIAADVAAAVRVLPTRNLIRERGSFDFQSDLVPRPPISLVWDHPQVVVVFRLSLYTFVKMVAKKLLYMLSLPKVQECVFLMLRLSSKLYNKRAFFQPFIRLYLCACDLC